MPHFTCVGNTRDRIDAYLADYLDFGIENLLLLRGDPPKDRPATPGDFAHASDLIEYVAARHPGLALGAACYPETHIEAASPQDDARRLKQKQDMGAGFFVSQLCYDPEAYERFTLRIEKEGVTVPVIMGVMPVLSKDGLIRMTLSNGCCIPAGLAALIGKYGDDEADFRKAGREFTLRLIERYLAIGIQGLHLYTMNKHEDLAKIADRCDMKYFREVY
jgi:methylenetetrahydrofolate reductase (NADPH)